MDREGTVAHAWFLIVIVALTSLFALVMMPKGVSAYTPHAPILINGNADFTFANGVTGGSGTWNDPYIIEGWDVNASTATGIYVQNTHARFIIRNSWIHSGGPIFMGLRFNNVFNGRVENVTSESNRYGIDVGHSRDITIANCTFLSNDMHGVYLSSSSSIVVAGNLLSGNWNGIDLTGSAGNIISGNDVSSNGFDGIEISLSGSNLIANNTVSFNGENGISISTDWNTITNNTVHSNKLVGILVERAAHDTFLNNTMFSNGMLIEGDLLGYWNTHTIDTSNKVNGKPVQFWKDRIGGTVPLGAGQVILANCEGVTVERQNVSDTSVGIQLGFSNRNVLTNNTISSNSWFGVSLVHSSNNTVAYNNVSTDNQFGIVLQYSSSNNNLTGNILSLNVWGFYMSLSDRNTFNGNTVSSSSRIGFEFHVSHWNSLTNNTLLGNWGAIDLDRSSFNTISYNILSNKGGGIALRNSPRNSILDNSALDNYGFVDLDSSAWVVVANNSVSGNNVGIDVQSSQFVSIVNNSFSRNHHSIYVDSSANDSIAHNTISSGIHEGIVVLRSNNITVAANTVTRTAAGIKLERSSKINVVNNTAWKNTHNIYLDSSLNNVVAGNAVSSARWYGIYLTSSKSNLVYHNLIDNNSRQAYDDKGLENLWDIGCPGGGNFWSDYKGVDEVNCLNGLPSGDGLGDTAYVIDSDSKDRYPLIRGPSPNFSPVANAGGPYSGYESALMTLDASASYDSDNDSLTYRWDFENDGIADTPWSSSPITTHIWSDDYSGIVRVEVSDNKTTANATATVTILNLPPILMGNVTAQARVSLVLRVAGEKWHDVTATVFRNGVEEYVGRVVRSPGSPDDQAITLCNLKMDVLSSDVWSAEVVYTPEDDPINGQVNGADPVWMIFRSEHGNESSLHHTFNVEHNETWTWNVPDLRKLLIGISIDFKATAMDPGSDDLTFTWDWGDGSPTTATTYYNDGIGPDPYPSPDDTFPVTATDAPIHAFAVTGTYTVTLRVSDDDGGANDVVLVIAMI